MIGKLLDVTARESASFSVYRLARDLRWVAHWQGGDTHLRAFGLTPHAALSSLSLKVANHYTGSTS